jgi:anti-sigma factor RsiW
MRQVLDAWIDGELDAVTAGDIEQHLDQCPACLALKSDRDILRGQVRAQAPYYNAPPALRSTILNRLDQTPPTAQPSPRSRNWLGAGALATIAALLGLLAGYWMARPLPDDSVREQLVASHVASLNTPQRLITVDSNNQHVVKPWLQGKIDFAPMVRDLSTHGYTLLGARLDHVGDRQAVAVVYRMRNHVINLFVWRAADYTAANLALQSARGFGMATWADGGLRYAAVSDIERGDLERFAQLAQAP